jgi:hypothetical protein
VFIPNPFFCFSSFAFGPKKKKADFTISAGLHFRYGISYNEFGVQGDQELYRNKLAIAQKNFMDMWEGVKAHVEANVRYARAIEKNPGIGLVCRSGCVFVSYDLVERL